MKKLLAILTLLFICSCGGDSATGSDNVDRCTQTSDSTTNCVAEWNSPSTRGTP